MKGGCTINHQGSCCWEFQQFRLLGFNAWIQEGGSWLVQRRFSLEFVGSTLVQPGCTAIQTDLDHEGGLAGLEIAGAGLDERAHSRPDDQPRLSLDDEGRLG